ncbi:unnamed protein product [Leuciscus chuanchicus]
MVHVYGLHDRTDAVFPLVVSHLLCHRGLSPQPSDAWDFIDQPCGDPSCLGTNLEPTKERRSSDLADPLYIEAYAFSPSQVEHAAEQQRASSRPDPVASRRPD